MKVQYDAMVDALSVQLTPGGKDVTTREIAPGVFLDFDSKGRLKALEVLNASRHVPRAELEQHPYPVTLLTLQQASKESGLSPITLRRQIGKGRIQAIKRGRDWFINEVELLNYLEGRAASGRPAINVSARQKRATRKSSRVTHVS